MLTVWGRKTSSNVQALMWCIGELGLPYVCHDVGHRYGGTDTEAFYALNPNRTIPVLQDGDNPPLWETGAILRYLASRYGSDAFWPADLLERSDIDRWAEWSKINIALAFTGPVFWRVVRTPQKDWDTQAISSAVLALERNLKIADDRLIQRQFLVGNRLTLADIQFGHVLYRYYKIKIERSPFLHLKQYYDRLSERPSFKEYVMISYEDLQV